MGSPPPSRPFGRALWPVTLAVAVVVLLIGYRAVRHGTSRPLTVYCAHDAVYAEAILRDFEKEAGIPLAIRYDTEATKSLGLVELLIRQRDAPRADVFWNNQLLGTLDLAERGILHPYKGPGYARIPDTYKDPQGRWSGFGARLRVFIRNTSKSGGTPQEAERQFQEGDLSRFAIAKPLYGTTLTHYAVLCDLWGLEKLKAWHAGCRTRGVREVLGNATVKNVVAEGVCDLGLTDTDDFFVAKDAGKPVTMFPARVGKDRRVICIPNTVAVIKGTRRLDDAQRLVDFLLSEACEVRLANSKSRQAPLGAVDATRLPGEVKDLMLAARNGYPLAGLAEARRQCLAWLKTEYVR